MKKYIFTAALASTLLATSCSDSEGIENVIPNDQKEKISFSLSDGSAQTRAGFTGDVTRIIARMQSDEKNSSNVRYTKCVLLAQKDNTGGPESYSTVNYSSASETRYWDDAYGRKGQISVYAVAIPNSTDESKLTESLITGGSNWAPGSSAENTIDWSVSADQSSNPLAAEDLVYSNNIQEGGRNGRYTWSYTSPVGYPENNGGTNHKDGRLIFTQAPGAQASDAGHFDKGHLMFTHSLSRLSVTLKEGEGFDGNDATAADFNFTNTGDNICLLNMNSSGTLDIKEGTWSGINRSNITKMAVSGTPVGANGTYVAQMIPGYKIYENGVENVMRYVIDYNTYYVTQAQIYEALNVPSNETKLDRGNDANGNYIVMQQQKHYKLTITVNKTGIASVTATLAEWVDVSGSTSIDNAHLTFTMSATGTACDKDIDIYRLGDDNGAYDENNYDFSYKGKNWYGNYTDLQTLLQTGKKADGSWATNWYFESNKTYYHFRTVNKGTEIQGNDDDGVNDYFKIEAGSTDSTDPHWGAPMSQGTNPKYLKYDTSKGYEAYLYPAIGATKNNIAIQEIHMMSNINVILQTPGDGSRVTLKNGDNKTRILITRIAKKGTVEMGRGVVNPTGPYTDELTMDAPTGTYFETDGLKTNAYTYTVVPQSLSRDFSSTSDDDYVGLFIQTPDNNQYYVVKNLSQITATEVNDERDQTQGQRIMRWYPGHTYTYTITISKKGIESITCTVADWVEVKGEDIGIDLES